MEVVKPSICGDFVARYERKNRPNHAVVNAICFCYVLDLYCSAST